MNKIKAAIICDQVLDLDIFLENEIDEVDGVNTTTLDKLMLTKDVIEEKILEANIRDKNTTKEEVLSSLNCYSFSPDYKGDITTIRFYKMGMIWFAGLELYDQDCNLFYHEPIDWSLSLKKLKKRSYNRLKEEIRRNYTILDNGEIVDVRYDLNGNKLKDSEIPIR